MLGVSLGAVLLQVRGGMQFQRNERPDNATVWPVAFFSKSLTSTEMCYRNTERESLGILHGLEKFYYYCFTHEVSMITDHQLLVAIFKKYIANLSHRLQRILLCIH